MFIDCMVQQALVKILVLIYDSGYLNQSYSFRHDRSSQDAITEALGYYNEGYASVVDLDITKYFNMLNHEMHLIV